MSATSLETAMDSAKAIVGYEHWLELLRSSCARYSAERVDGQPFTGWVRPFAFCGITGTDVACNAWTVERTQRDIKLDEAEYFVVGQQRTGAADVMQNDRIVRAQAGDFVLMDTSRPMQYRPISGISNLLSLQLPRTDCVAHLGFEPEGGVCRPGDSLAAHLLGQLFQRACLDNGLDRECELHVDVIVYDLVRALFGAVEWPSVSPHSDRLFHRVCRIVKRHFTDADFGPTEIAAETGISLRYLQKLFTNRGSTCSQYIQSLRLEHAFTLLKRRAERKGGQSVSEIAWAAGYRDLNHFYRLFRQRFGHTPGATQIAGRP
jgi:AraC family transcriptional regulator, positive regulator of tynA and feaB